VASFREYHYVLDEHGDAVPEPAVERWARWFENANRHVGYWSYELPAEEIKRLASPDKPYFQRFACVSTVFLGLDHNMGFGHPHAKPVLWESLMSAPFESWHETTVRHTSRGQARACFELWARLMQAFYKGSWHEREAARSAYLLDGEEGLTTLLLSLPSCPMVPEETPTPHQQRRALQPPSGP
jgi:hypothetical protein